ncbi:MAG: RNA-binding cell elongation regulator Jag/EloR [Chloroflexota bacterium]
MSEYQEFTGKTVEEALKSAGETFDVSGLQDLDFEILTQGSRGVLGMGAEPARIIAAPKSALSGATPRREAAESAAPSAAAPAEAPRPETPEAEGSDQDGDTAAASGAPQAEPKTSGEPKPGKRDEHSRGHSSRGSREPSGISGSASAEVEAAVAAGAGSPDVRAEINQSEASAEALAAAKEILEQLVELMGYDAAVEVTTGPSAKITVFGADDEEKEALGALIGRKGERLSALQHLVNLMLSRRMGTWTRVLVDVEDYRGRRERQLIEVAQRAAKRVEETGQMLQLEPMSALERRWVHIALRDVDGVSTQSIGEEPMRRVVVIKA